MERLTELTPIQTPFTLMLPILIIHDARAPTIQVRALETAPLKTAPCAQNGAVHSNAAARSKRRRALKTAPRVQTVRRAQNGAARSKRRGAFKRCCAFKRGSAGGRQGVGRLVRRGRQGGRQIS
jgi:ribosomal protein S20